MGIWPFSDRQLLNIEDIIMKNIIFATIGFFVGTVAVSFVWYALLLPQYEATGLMEMGYEETSNYAIWYINILITGLALSYLYDYLSSTKRVPVVLYVAMTGLLVWLWSVLAMLGWLWQDIDSITWFVTLQTTLIIVQFAVYGLVLRWVYRPSS